MEARGGSIQAYQGECGIMDDNRHICRGKRKDNGRWVEGYYHKLERGIEDGPLHIIIDRTGQYNTVLPETVGECTGYLDTMGRLVYEGDIVKSPDGEEWIVEYDDGSGWFIIRGKDADKVNRKVPLGLTDEVRVEIIGCVHEVAKNDGTGTS